MKYFLLILFCPFFLFAQSEFLEGQSGIKADFMYSGQKDYKAAGGGFGFSIMSRVDLGYQSANSSYKELYSPEASSKLVYAAVNVKSKKSNFKFLLGYSESKISDRYKGKISFRGPIISFNVCAKMTENELIALMPDFGFTLGILYPSVDGISDGQDVRTAHLGLNFISKGEVVRVVVTPSIAMDLVRRENSILYGISLGLLVVLPTANE